MGIFQENPPQELDISSNIDNAIKNQIINSLCKIFIKDQYKGVGFLCKISNFNSSTYNIPILVTYNHLVKRQNILNNDKITISISNDPSTYTVTLNNKSIYTNIDLDITIIELKSNEEVKFLDIDIYEDRTNLNGNKLVFLLHSMSSIIDIKIFYGKIKNVINNTNVYYDSNFNSLVPNKGLILNPENNKVIGLLNNKNNESENQGIFLTTPIKDFIKIYEDTQKTIKSQYNLIYQNQNRLTNTYNLNGFNQINNNMSIVRSYYNHIPFQNLYYPEILPRFQPNNIILSNSYQQRLTQSLSTKELSNSGNRSLTSSYYENNLSYIEILLEINENDLNKKIYFLDNTDFEGENGQKHFHDNLKELSGLNTTLIINNQILKFEKFYIFKQIGKYNVKLQFLNQISNCGFMFYDCINITQIDFSHFNSKNVVNMEYMFYYCENLRKINLSNLVTTNVINMNCMFYRCNNLTEIDLNSFDTKNVKNMNHMFSHCKNISSLNLSSFITSNTVNMGYMFYECSKLLTLDLSTFNTQNVSNMSHMFMRCSSLQNLNINNFITKKVLDMSYMFHDCKNLNELNLSSFDFQDNVDMDHMLYYCKKLKVIYINNNSYKKLKKYKDSSTYESKFDIKIIK